MIGPRHSDAQFAESSIDYLSRPSRVGKTTVLSATTQTLSATLVAVGLPQTRELARPLQPDSRSAETLASRQVEGSGTAWIKLSAAAANAGF